MASDHAWMHIFKVARPHTFGLLSAILVFWLVYGDNCRKLIQLQPRDVAIRIALDTTTRPTNGDSKIPIQPRRLLKLQRNHPEREHSRTWTHFCPRNRRHSRISGKNSRASPQYGHEGRKLPNPKGICIRPWVILKSGGRKKGRITGRGNLAYLHSSERVGPQCAG